MAGLLFALEGIDGSGTTTHAALLSDWMRGQGLRVHRTREPSSGPVGHLLRLILSGRSASSPDAVALLFAADRLDHLAREIDPALRDGAHVVTDRYVLSSLAYQSVSLPLPWVVEINSRARRPDACFVLSIRAEIGAERRADRPATELFDGIETQRAVATAYARLAPVHGATVVNGERPIGEVQAELRSHLARVLGIE